MLDAQFITFASFFAAASVVPAALFYILWWINNEVSFWPLAGSAHLFLSSGLILRGYKNDIPEPAFLISSNTLTAIGLVLMALTVRLIQSEWRFWKIDLMIFVSIVGAMSFIVASPANSYEIRVALISCLIIAVSVTISSIAFSALKRMMALGTLIFLFFGTVGSVVSFGRLVAAITLESNGVFSLALWDKIFFLWSLAALFVFASGVFASGARVILANASVILAQQQKLAESLRVSLEEQDALRKIVLHEIRRPISNITTVLQTSMRDGRLGQQSIDQLKLLAAEASRYLDGVGEYDELADLIASLKRSEINLGTFTADIERKWHIPVNVRPNLQHSSIRADYFLLSISIDNVIENALKFCKQSSQIQLQIHHNKNYVCFDIADDGEGIPPEYHEQVFQRFFRAPSNFRLAKGEGAGLGLYIAAQIAEAHGGYASVLSQTPSVVRLAIPAG